MAVVILITNGGRVQASYKGGEYIEVAFGENQRARDVINVFDYKAGKPRIPNTAKAVEKALLAWLKEGNGGFEVYETRLLS
jgi:hypothetical protein